MSETLTCVACGCAANIAVLVKRGAAPYRDTPRVLCFECCGGRENVEAWNKYYAEVDKVAKLGADGRLRAFLWFSAGILSALMFTNWVLC